MSYPILPDAEVYRRSKQSKLKAENERLKEELEMTHYQSPFTNEGVIKRIEAEKRQILLEIRAIIANPKKLGYRLAEIEEYIDKKLAQGRG